MANDTVVTRCALCELIRETLDNKELSKTVMSPFALSTQVNPVVSPAAPYDYPLNPDFVPQDKQEFIVSMQRAVRGFDVSQIPKLYKAICDALEEFGLDPETRVKTDIEKEKEEKRTAALNGRTKEQNMKAKTDTKEESVVRSIIKKMIAEARGNVPSEEDDPAPDMSDPGYSAWEERQEERERQAAFARRGQHEKNIMSDVPATSVSKELGVPHATYVKGEQQLLNKMISRLLDPKTPKAARSSAMDSYVRTTFNDWLNAVADTFSEQDPDINDPAIEKFFLNIHDPNYQSMLYDSDEFKQYYIDTVHEDAEEAITQGADPRATKGVEKELTALYSSLGHGYGRLDQDPASFSRLRGLFTKHLSDDDEEDLPGSDLEKGVPARSHGRKAQAGQAVGKKRVPSRPAKK